MFTPEELKYLDSYPDEDEEEARPGRGWKGFQSGSRCRPGRHCRASTSPGHCAQEMGPQPDLENLPEPPQAGETIR